MKLQELCHRRRWSLPEYYAINIDGPPHNPRFKAYVFVNGVTFTSSDTFNSSKEAHNQAAMKAFLNFSSPPSCTLSFHGFALFESDDFIE
jgi:dsRNA-specific ribonuclease